MAAGKPGEGRNKLIEIIEQNWELAKTLHPTKTVWTKQELAVDLGLDDKLSESTYLEVLAKMLMVELPHEDAIELDKIDTLIQNFKAKTIN